MRFALLVLTPPDAGTSARHALGFSRALLDAGHSLACVFFFDAGVLTLCSDCEAPQDEMDIRAGWRDLQREHELRLFACVASAARFGISAEGDPGDSPAFSVAGLGELIEASGEADRLLTFRG
jgi:tRNA 2-thiouridine synthesizing protein D